MDNNHPAVRMYHAAGFEHYFPARKGRCSNFYVQAAAVTQLTATRN
jgi:hypothetical protein